MSELRWEQRPGMLRDPIMVAAFRGWNDAAAAATSALSYVAGRVDAQRVGAIEPDEFYDLQVTRPTVDLTAAGGGAISWPEVELLAGPAGERDVLLLSGPEPSMRWRAFCRTILDAAAELGAATIVTLGAFLADVPHTRPVRLTGISSDPQITRSLGLRDPTYQGPTGIVGVLQHFAAARGMRAISLWAPASHYAASVTNAKAALALVRGLHQVTGIQVDLTDLQIAADRYERQVARAVSSDPRLSELVSQLEAASDAEQPEPTGPLPSGDDLAQELERYLRDLDAED